jgi:cytochrome c-type biogenesis protein CcmF
MRASGPYIGHVGLIMMLAAITLNSSLQQENRVTVNVGQVSTSSGQNVRLVGLSVDQRADRDSFIATVDVLDGGGRTIDQVQSRLDSFSDGQTHANVGILTGWRQDVYVVLDEADLTKKVATLTIFTNPTVVWIWGGGLLLSIGGVLFAIPRRRTAPPLPTDHHHDDHELVEV